jgi:hypothetical protein
MWFSLIMYQLSHEIWHPLVPGGREHQGGHSLNGTPKIKALIS